MDLKSNLVLRCWATCEGASLPCSSRAGIFCSVMVASSQLSLQAPRRGPAHRGSKATIFAAFYRTTLQQLTALLLFHDCCCDSKHPSQTWRNARARRNCSRGPVFLDDCQEEHRNCLCLTCETIC